ncbi:hypothetical protein KK470_30360, partial [Klebsiella pneumoniae]|uniref:hypothetical protein n=1 Tax=Klebsiella pneumoniae TaxID=573 RepID=UPI001BE0181D
TFNRYAYALNSPYKFTDPLGLIPSTTGACGQWCQNYASDQWGGSTEFDSLAGAPPIWPFIYEVTRQTTITYRGENG